MLRSLHITGKDFSLKLKEKNIFGNVMDMITPEPETFWRT
jgi:hypothetical protein